MLRGSWFALSRALGEAVREENDLGELEADASCLRCSVVIEVGGVSRSWQTARGIRQSESLFC